MKTCLRAVLENGQPGRLLDLSFVVDDHEFGPSPDGAEIHIPGRGEFTVTRGTPYEKTPPEPPAVNGIPFSEAAVSEDGYVSLKGPRLPRRAGPPRRREDPHRGDAQVVSIWDEIAADPDTVVEHVLTVTPAEGVAYDPLKPGDFITAWDREYLILTAEPGLFEREWKYLLEPAGDFCGPCARRDHTACEGGDGLSMTGCGCYVRRLDEAHDWTAEFSGGEL